MAKSNKLLVPSVETMLPCMYHHNFKGINNNIIIITVQKGISPMVFDEIRRM